MKIKNEKLVEIFNAADFRYTFLNNVKDFVNSRVLSVYIAKNITITLDCSIDMDKVGEILQIIMDYALKEQIDFIDIAVKFG